MKKHYEEDPWKIIEKGFHPDMQMSSESIFSLGNGRMGQRANFEENFFFFREIMLPEFITPIKPALAGGRMVTLNISPRC